VSAAQGIEVSIRMQHPVVLDVEFEASASELVALVGPSGGGKSTILRAIAGLEKPDQGTISVGGQQWFDSDSKLYVQPRQRRVGMVFQSYALFPHLSAQENVLQAIADGKTEDKAELADEYLARVNLKGLGARRPEQMSGGQRQRVAVARALAREPDVLLLDEPFSAVDKVTRIRLQRELVELRSNLSVPIILVTHDIEEAARLADRIAVLHEGRILQMAAHDLIFSTARWRASTVDSKNWNCNGAKRCLKCRTDPATSRGSRLSGAFPRTESWFTGVTGPRAGSTRIRCSASSTKCFSLGRQPNLLSWSTIRTRTHCTVRCRLMSPCVTTSVSAPTSASRSRRT
jgi:ABC-type sulfate/molybdate transport systems ATPase subunit